METGRVEAFSDGVIAVIITIMVLDLKIPHDGTWAGLRPQAPIFLAYVLSFVNVGIYWNNHHHLFVAAKKIDGRAMWANLHLLFWLSLVPFTTGWAGETHFGAIPVAAFGFDLMMTAVAYVLLQGAILAINGPQSTLGRAVGNDWKGKVSLGSYIVSIPAAFVAPWVSLAIYVGVAAIWFIPDRRIERVAVEEAEGLRGSEERSA